MSAGPPRWLLPAAEVDRSLAPDERAAWLTAYALGLAYAAEPDHADVEALLDELEIAAGGDVELLRDARRRLGDVCRIDPDLRKRAAVLLTRTATRIARRDRPPG